MTWGNLLMFLHEGRLTVIYFFLHLRPYSLNIKFELGICCIYWTYCETACQFVPYLFFFKCLTSFSNNNWWLLFWNIFHRKRDPRVAYFNGPCCRCQKHGCESDNRSCASWDVASASEKHWRTTFNVITSPEVKLWRFVVLGNRQLAVKPFSAHPGSSFCLLVFIVSTWTCTGTAGSSWWKDSWTMRCSRSPTCPTSTRRILTAAITELWRTGSASWSRDCWPSSPSVRWCVSTWTVSKGATPANDNTFSDTVILFLFTGKMLTTQSAQTRFLKGFTSPRGVLLTFVSAEPHSLGTALPWKICQFIIPLLLDNNTCWNEPPFILNLANKGSLFNSAWFKWCKSKVLRRNFSFFGLISINKRRPRPQNIQWQWAEAACLHRF